MLFAKSCLVELTVFYTNYPFYMINKHNNKQNIYNNIQVISIYYILHLLSITLYITTYISQMMSCVPYKLCELDKSKFYVTIVVVRLCDLGSSLDLILYTSTRNASSSSHIRNLKHGFLLNTSSIREVMIEKI